MRRRDSGKWVCEVRKGFIEWENHERISTDGEKNKCGFLVGGENKKKK